MEKIFLVEKGEAMGTTVLITGAAGGLGVEFAKIYARKGYNLVLTARNGDRLRMMKKKLEERYGIHVDCVVRDLVRKNAAREIFAYTQRKEIEVDILVNNAGFGDYGRYVDCDWGKQYEMIQVNMTALAQLTHCFLNPMIERGSGKILNVASVASFEPGPLMSVYYASKAFVLSFTEALSVELEGTGVTVTALCPGPTKTGFEKNADLQDSNLFKNLKNASAGEVARYGVRALNAKKVIAIHGRWNRAIAGLVKFAPRKWVRKCVYWIQK